MNFYFINNQNKVIDVLSNDVIGDHIPITQAIIDEKLNSYDELTLTIQKTEEDMKPVEQLNTVLVNYSNKWREYIVREIEDESNGMINRTITADLSSIELLDTNILKELKNSSDSARIVMDAVLKGTRWEIGIISPEIKSKLFNQNVEDRNVLEALSAIALVYEAEISYSYTVKDNRIDKRFD